jgi:hypothetical protein
MRIWQEIRDAFNIQLKTESVIAEGDNRRWGARANASQMRQTELL